MTDCIFCKIRDGEIPTKKVYEDDKVFAILDTSQVTPGHTLLITKEHVRNIFDYDDKFASEIFSRVPKIAKAVKSHNEDVKGLNIVMNNEEIAYQSVFHSHIHLIPRYHENDGFELYWADNGGKYSDEQMDSIKNNIVDELEEN